MGWLWVLGSSHELDTLAVDEAELAVAAVHQDAAHSYSAGGRSAQNVEHPVERHNFECQVIHAEIAEPHIVCHGYQELCAQT